MARDESTRIDLGSDLLKDPQQTKLTTSEKNNLPPVILTDGATPSSLNGSNQAENLLKNASLEALEKTEIIDAQILIDEGLPSRARRLLHQAIVDDPADQRARELLDQLMEPSRQDEWSAIADGELQWLKEFCDADEECANFPLVSDELSIHEYCIQLEKHLQGSTVRDRMDLANAFLEMELPKVALHLASPLIGSEATPDAIALEARAYSLLGDLGKAMGCWQRILTEREASRDHRAAAMRGVIAAHSTLGQKAAADEWRKRLKSLYPDIASSFDS